MVNDQNARGRALSVRGRLGELLHHSGLLQPVRWARRLWDHDLRILAYHRVLVDVDTAHFDFDLELVSATAAQFRREMTLVRRRYHPMCLREVAARLAMGEPLPRNAIVVTFDDGYDDNFSVARPILLEMDVPATFFVSTGVIDSGQPFAYDWFVYMLLNAPVQQIAMPGLDADIRLPAGRDARRRLATCLLDRLKDLHDDAQQAVITGLEQQCGLPRAAAPAACRPMTWPQLRQMHSEGFEIGSHGVSHRMLAKLPGDALRAELETSMKRLEAELGAPVTSISYPVGGDRAFDAAVMAATKAAGYQLACSYICGTNAQPIANPFALYRLPVEREMDIGWYASMLALPRLMTYPTARRAKNPVKGGACSY